MALLLVILIPLAALVIYAVVSDLRRRRRRGAVRSHDISSAARAARAEADARGASGLRPPDGGTPGAAGLIHGP
jgi:hypothetical protein